MSELSLKRKRIDSSVLSFSDGFVSSEKQRDVTKLENLIRKLEHKLSELETKAQSDAITRESAIQEKVATIQKLITSEAEAQRHAVYHKERYDEATQTLATMKEKHNAVANELRSTLEKQRQETRKLESTVQSQTEEIRKLIQQRETDQQVQSIQTKSFESMIASLKASAESDALKMEQALHREAKLNERIHQMEQERTSQYPTSSEAAEKLDAQFQSIIRRSFDLESENHKLKRDLDHYKSISQNVELLRSERDGLQRQAEALSELRATHFQLEAEMAQLRAEQADWAAYVASQPEFKQKKPDSVIYELTRKAEEADFLKRTVEQYQAQVKDQWHVIQSLESHLTELKKEVAEQKERRAIEASARTKLSVGADAWRQYIHLLETQLAVYADQDVGEDTKSKQIAELQQHIQQCQDKITALSQQLAEQEAQKADQAPIQVHLSNGPYEALASGLSLTDFLKQLVEKENQLIEELKQKSVNEAILQKQYDATKEQVERLQTSVRDQQPIQIPSDIVPIQTKQSTSTETQTTQDQDTRYLTVLDNPLSQDYAIRKSLLQRLQKENQSLLDQLADKSGDTILIPAISLENLKIEKTELQATIESRDKRIARLHAVWGNKIQQIVTEIQLLLGYNVNFRNDDLIRLEHALVDPTELAFLVKLETTQDETQGILRFVGSKRDAYMSQLQDIYQTYIIQDRNIPAFLNAAAQDIYVHYKEQHQSIELEMQHTPLDDQLEPYDEETRIHLDTGEDGVAEPMEEMTEQTAFDLFVEEDTIVYDKNEDEIIEESIMAEHVTQTAVSDGEMIEHESDGEMIETEIDQDITEQESEMIEPENEGEMIQHESEGEMVEHESESEMIEHESEGEMIEHESEGELAEHEIEREIIESENDQQENDTVESNDEDITSELSQ
ncbi:Spindle assembly checkpoint component MAD1 [Choanephora cucurbitarum]|uniref:Spindle assembly checkpoint component MAD1 n=1 Tax=Choanephora cucurbitarum TaxID=101091 RepID=A0A1C7NTD4_9FUNG|nr:Spindle assembly checkpoint component MAD1 [Choanephora cucurbitarum]